MLAVQLRELVETAFRVTAEEYAAEVSRHNASLGLAGDFSFVTDVRPKFWTGDPVSIRPGAYVLVISLNHKFTRAPTVDAEVSDLNESSEAHYRACAEHFTRHRVYSFYRNFAPVLNEMGLGLASHAFFMDALPFFSRRSRRLSAPEIRGCEGRLVELNREAVRCVVTSAPPALVYVNGTTAQSALESWGAADVDWRAHYLASATSAGQCRVDLARLHLFGVPIRAVRSNFLRSVYGPNSRDQLRELGALMATFDEAFERPARRRLGHLRVAEPRPTARDFDGDHDAFLRLTAALLQSRFGRLPKSEGGRGHSVALQAGIRLYVEAVTRNLAGYPIEPGELLMRVRVGADKDEDRRRALGQMFTAIRAEQPEGATFKAQDADADRPRWVETYWVHEGDMNADLELAETLVDWWLATLRRQAATQ